MTDYYSKRKFVSKPDDLPDTEHYAIIYSSSHTDGYGGTAQHVEYVAFTDRAAWEAAIQEETANQKSYRTWRAIHVRPAKIKTTIHITTDLNS